MKEVAPLGLHEDVQNAGQVQVCDRRRRVYVGKFYHADNTSTYEQYLSQKLTF